MSERSPGYQDINGPLPLPPRYGLLQAAEAPAAGVSIVPDGAETIRWGNGVTVWPYPPDVPSVWDSCNPGSPGFKTLGAFADSDNEAPFFDPMTVYIAETCKSWRMGIDQDAFRARALAAFAASEAYGVEREFLTGETLSPTSTSLSNGPNLEIVNSGSSLPPLLALAALEDALASHGRLGLIHVSPGYATLLRANLAIDDKTGVLRTISGNVVIPGVGYSAKATPSGQSEATEDQEWIYGTGPIEIRRSETFIVPGNVSEALDRGFNDTGEVNVITYRAERYYLVDWDAQVHYAVLADRCQTDCG